jgi:hypothetical protein
VRGARADFRTCGDTTARPAALRLPQGGGDDPWWIPCENGCCIASGGFQG